MPLRHIGVIVIWEGNYNPDNNSIGINVTFHEYFFHKLEKLGDDHPLTLGTIIP